MFKTRKQILEQQQQQHVNTKAAHFQPPFEKSIHRTEKPYKEMRIYIYNLYIKFFYIAFKSTNSADSPNLRK